MHKLTDILDKFNLSGIVLTGLDKLADEDKALEIFEKLENEWQFVLNHKVTGRIGQCRYPHPGVVRRNGSYVHPRRFGEIEIHGLLMEEDRAETRDNTILHEVAHAVDWMLNARTTPHGLNWKRIMRAFGLVPERCNTDLSLSDDIRAQKARKAKLMYRCQRCEHEFPAMRRKKYAPENYTHGRVSRGQCGGKLYLQQDAMGRKYANPSKPASYGIAACKV